MSAAEYSRLIEAYKATEGYAIYWQIHSIIVSHGLFLGNHEDLHHKLAESANPGSAALFFDQGRRSESDKEFRELVRLLHNYGASVKSLIDHTRRIAKKLLDQPSLDTYEQRVECEFTNDPASKFLHDLRNYLLHVSHPPIRAKLHFDRPHSHATGIELASSELLQWSRWTALSLAFINQNPNDIPLLALVDDYERKVFAFYHWLIDYLYDACGAAMDEFWTKQDEWAAYCRMQGIPITEEEFREFITPKRSKPADA